jgi:hypothetical protein
MTTSQSVNSSQRTDRLRFPKEFHSKHLRRIASPLWNNTTNSSYPKEISCQFTGSNPPNRSSRKPSHSFQPTRQRQQQEPHPTHSEQSRGQCASKADSKRIRDYVRPGLGQKLRSNPSHNLSRQAFHYRSLLPSYSSY